MARTSLPTRTRKKRQQAGSGEDDDNGHFKSRANVESFLDSISYLLTKRALHRMSFSLSLHMP
jgi:hypothetical protein